MTDDSVKEPCRAGKQQSMPSKRSWIALLFAGLGVALAVHRGSTLLQSWQWEELGSVQPLLWLPISFRQPQDANATALLVQVVYVSEQSLSYDFLLFLWEVATTWGFSDTRYRRCDLRAESLRCQLLTAGQGSARCWSWTVPAVRHSARLQ